jgi:hypothetical protein
MFRPFETRYWVDNRRSKPVTRGFPKAEAGSVSGAAKAAMRGFVSKVQCIDRNTGSALWTVVRGAKLPGRPIYNVEVLRGDGEPTPRRKA